MPPSINGKKGNTKSYGIPQPRLLSHRKKMRQNQSLLFTSNLKHPEIFLSVAQEWREGEFKKQDHIYLFIEDFFLPGHKYRNQGEVCLWAKPRSGESVEDNKNMPAMMSFVKYLKFNRKRSILNLSPWE